MSAIGNLLDEQDARIAALEAELAAVRKENAALSRQRDEALEILTEARSEGMVWADGQYGYKTAARVAAALSPARTAELIA